MADLGQTEVVAAEPPPPAAPKIDTSRNPILDDAIVPTLLRLALPNIVAMGAGISVLIAETTYVGILGIAPLAAIALMFPLIILMMTMSGGAMGGGVASAIARALGAGDRLRASTLALHALTIGIGVGTTFSVLLLTFGEQILTWMGGRDAVLAEALAFSQIYLLQRRAGLDHEHAGGDPARHRQHDPALGDRVRVGGMPDRSRRHAQPRPVRRATIRHSRHRHRPAQRRRDRRSGDGLVRAERPQPHLAARTEFPVSSRDVHRHSEGRRAGVLLSGAGRADQRRADVDAGTVWTRRCSPPTASVRDWNSS